MRRRDWGRLWAALTVTGCLAATGQAGLLPTNVSIYPEADGSYRWQYAIVLPTDSQLKAGDYFTIYDFAGFKPGTVISPSADWTFTTANVGPTPAGVLPSDDPAIPNLSWQYTGPTIAVGQTGLGNFMADSLYQVRTDSFFTARTHRAADGKVDANVSYTDVPVPSAVPAVPEPATAGLAALGLPLLGLARRRRGVGPAAVGT